MSTAVAARVFAFVWIDVKGTECVPLQLRHAALRIVAQPMLLLAITQHLPKLALMMCKLHPGVAGTRHMRCESLYGDQDGSVCNHVSVLHCPG